MRFYLVKCCNANYLSRYCDFIENIIKKYFTTWPKKFNTFGKYYIIFQIYIIYLLRIPKKYLYCHYRCFNNTLCDNDKHTLTNHGWMVYSLSVCMYSNANKYSIDLSTAEDNKKLLIILISTNKEYEMLMMIIILLWLVTVQIFFASLERWMA